MSLLFNKGKATINEHILNIFKEKELEKESVMRKIGNSDFSIKPTNFYSMITEPMSITLKRKTH